MDPINSRMTHRSSRFASASVLSRKQHVGNVARDQELFGKCSNMKKELRKIEQNPFYRI